MKKYLIFSFIVLNSALYAQNFDEAVNTTQECQTLKSIYPLNPEPDTSRNGLVIISYHDEEGNQLSMLTKGYYLNGVPNGNMEVFRFNGHRFASGNMVNGHKSGKWTYYHPNSVIMEEGKYDYDKDSSFQRVDCFIHPFLNDSYFEFGIDSIASPAELNCDIVPYLNIGYYRDYARTGIWTYYDRVGNILADVEFKNDKMMNKIPYNPRKNIVDEQVEFIAFYQGDNQWYRYKKVEYNTQMLAYFVYTYYDTDFGRQIGFPKQKQPEFYPLAGRPVLTEIDSVKIDGKYYLLYQYYQKNCYEDGPECAHGHVASHNDIIFSPDYGRIVEVTGFTFHPKISILSHEWMEGEDQATYLAILKYVILNNEDILTDQFDHIKDYFKIE